MSSATVGLNGYFKSYVDPYRGTVLVQGGHQSGKTTLLNALLGYHALPYFSSKQQQQVAGGDQMPQPVHGQTTSRFAAGLGSTAVAVLNAASVDPSGKTLSVTRPESGCIQHLIVPSSMTFGGFTRPGDLPIPPEISKTTFVLASAGSRTVSGMGGPQDSASINDPSNPSAANLGGLAPESSAFAFVEKVYPNDFDVVGEVNMSKADPWQSRTMQAFYYDAVNAMEASWREWATKIQSNAKQEATDAERMLFVVGVNKDGAEDTKTFAKDFSKIHPDKIECGPDAMPPLNCVESTDLSDRPPMTFVHSSVVVLTDTHDAPTSGNDSDGARRMYVQSSLFTRANNEPCLVYNLVEGSLHRMSDDELEELRTTLARIWNVRTENVYILSLRNALADAMLAHESIPAMNKKDTAELERLRRLITSQHVQAHNRFTERVLTARQKLQAKREGLAHLAEHPVQPTSSAYVPKVLTQEYQAEKTQVAVSSASAAGNSSACVTAKSSHRASTTTPSAEEILLKNPVLNNESTKVSHQVHKRQADYEPKCVTKQPIDVDNREFQPKCVTSPAPSTSTTYIPKVLASQGVRTKDDGYIPVCLREAPPAPKDDYIPKCAQASVTTQKPSEVRHQIKVESSSPQPTETRQIVVAPCEPLAELEQASMSANSSGAPQRPTADASVAASSPSVDMCSEANSSFDYFDDVQE